MTAFAFLLFFFRRFVFPSELPSQVFNQGDEGESFFIIRSGTALVLKELEEGTEEEDESMRFRA